ncbi:hypothetical protein SH467x_001547 [Pirellulaceae bacterium SH467]
MPKPHSSSTFWLLKIAVLIVLLLGCWGVLKWTTPTPPPAELASSAESKPKVVLYRGADAQNKDELAAELRKRLDGIVAPQWSATDIAVDLLGERARVQPHFADALLRGDQMPLLPEQVSSRREHLLAASKEIVDDFYRANPVGAAKLGDSQQDWIEYLADSWAMDFPSRSQIEKAGKESIEDPFIAYLQVRTAKSFEELVRASESGMRWAKSFDRSPVLRILLAANRTQIYGRMATELQGRDIEDGIDAIVDCAKSVDEFPELEEFLFPRFHRLVSSYNVHSQLFLLDRLDSETKGSCSELFRSALRGRIAEEIAFKYRGASYTYLVEDKDLEQFGVWAEIATRFYLESLRRAPSLAPVADALMRLERSAGCTGVTPDHWFRYVLSIDPEYLPAHGTFLSSRETKWGGGEASLLRYADQLHEAFPKSPTLGLFALQVLEEWAEERGFGATLDSDRVKSICQSAMNYLRSDVGKADHWMLPPSSVRILARLLWDCGDFEGLHWLLTHFEADLSIQFAIGVEFDLALAKDFCAAAATAAGPKVDWVSLQRGLFFDDTIRLSHPLVRVRKELDALTAAAEKLDSAPLDKVATLCQKVFQWREDWETKGEVILDFGNDALGWLAIGDFQVTSKGSMGWSVKMDDASSVIIPRFRVSPPLLVEIDVRYDKSSVDLYGFALLFGPLTRDTLDGNGVLFRMIGTRRLGMLDHLPQANGKLEGVSSTEIPWNYLVTHKMLLHADGVETNASIDGRNLPPVKETLKTQGLFKIGRWAPYQARGDLSATGRYEIQKVRFAKAP